MDFKAYLRVSVINLAFMATGLLVGPMSVYSDSWLHSVHAQTKEEAKEKAAPVAPISVKLPAECEHAECVVPAVGMPSAAIGTLLVGRLATDSTMVNGFDLLKLHDGVLTALQQKGILSRLEVEAILKNAKVDKPLRVRPAAAPQQ